jgi:endo-1,4-beta-xylanase
MKSRMKRNLALFIVVLFWQTLVTPPGSAQTLRQAAEKNRLLIGAAAQPAKFAEPDYADTLAREFNMLEPENAMKWTAIRPTPERFDFASGDAVVAFAQAHKMRVRGHTLVWALNNPAWLAKGNFTPAQLKQMLQEHISKVMQHYAGQVFAWDVVNEAFDAQGRLVSSIWYDAPGIGLAGKGTAYIEQAFRWARAADPNALLFYNDYGAESLNAKSDAIYAMVKDFKARGVPIDGVGLQTHIYDLNLKQISTLAANIRRFAALGVQVHITEMDVRLPLDADGHVLNKADLATQAEIYRRVAQTCLAQPACTAFQTWGFTDKYTWLYNYTKGKQGAPLLFDENYAPKASYYAVLDVLRRSRARQ